GQVTVVAIVRHGRAGGKRGEERRPVAVVDGRDEGPHGGFGDVTVGCHGLLLRPRPIIAAAAMRPGWGGRGAALWEWGVTSRALGRSAGGDRRRAGRELAGGHRGRAAGGGPRSEG